MPPSDPPMLAARSALQAGQLDVAERLCREALAGNPSDAFIWNLLGVIAGLKGNPAEAVACITRAAQAEPAVTEYTRNLASLYIDSGRPAEGEQWARRLPADYPEGRYLLGMALLLQSRLEEARICFQEAIALRPAYREAHNNLGAVLRAQRRFDEAIACCQKIIALDPHNSHAYSNLGSVLQDVGKLDEAEAHYQKAIALDGKNIEALESLGTLRHSAGRFVEAAEVLQRAVAISPHRPRLREHLAAALQAQGKLPEAAAHYGQVLQQGPSADALTHLGTVLHGQGKHSQAMAHYQQALALDPNHAGAMNNLGYLHAEDGHSAEALLWYDKALKVRPDAAEVHNNMGNAYRGMGHIDQAIQCYNRTILYKPDSHDGHWNKSLAHLLQGDFAHGWLEYEWRWLRFPEFKRRLPQPLWDGSNLHGKTILLHAEQGFGDTIQFVRLAPLVAQRGGRVLLESEPETARLLQTAPGITQVFSRGQPLPHFDFQIPLMSLPLVLNLSLQTVPNSVPYVHAAPALADAWNKKLAAHPGKMKIGLAWSGRPTHKNDKNRSIAFSLLAPLFALPDIGFVSLQKGSMAAQLAQVPHASILDAGAQINDFADTAAIIANLDLVISVDTAVAHLAGALAKPVYTLITFDPDWRWLLTRPDSPWYPTMKLFRQPAPGQWAPAIEALTDAVHANRTKIN